MKFIGEEKLESYLLEGWINVQKHPTLNLYIYNYSQKCQFARMWDDVTQACRGLILDGDNNIVARPFPKFFNLDEYVAMGGQLPAEDFEVFDKLDGSLGILYWDGELPCLATRGSFTSDQAIRGTKILREKYPDFDCPRGFTQLFEIIYPENRIVVDYKGFEDIVLLAAINNETGNEISYDVLKNIGHFKNHQLGTPDKLPPVVERFDGIRDVNTIKESILRDNAEGVVIRWKNGLRVKVKYDEYVRLHRILTGVNAKTIWEILKDGKELDELLEKVPDEFYQWVDKVARELKQQHTSIFIQASTAYGNVLDFETRKEQAEELQNFEHKDIVFKMLDKKPYQDLIWKKIRPQADKPFKEDIDG